LSVARHEGIEIDQLRDTVAGAIGDAGGRLQPSADASSSTPSLPTRHRGRRERFWARLNSLGRFPDVVVEGFSCDSTRPLHRVNVARNSAFVIPGWSEGPDPRCAIAHRGISNFSDVQLHIGVRIFDAPRNDRGISMNAAAISLLFVGALAGGFVSGLAGFGTALMALGIWLYVMPPSIAVPLVLICSVIAQISTLPGIWRSIDFKLVWPFLIGGLAGVPLGTMLIAHADPHVFKLTVGIFLLVFPVLLYLQRAPMALSFGGRPADAAVGFAGGILGGLAGLSGPMPILWASVRGWGKEERRGIFQTFNGTVLAAALGVQIATGFVKPEVFWLALLAFPATILGAWLGARTYRALSDRNFRDVVLGLLVLSGIGLVWSNSGH
jgi:uncharacterized membrane protein YfcA